MDGDARIEALGDELRTWEAKGTELGADKANGGEPRDEYERLEFHPDFVGSKTGTDVDN